MTDTPEPTTALVVRPAVLPSTAQLGVERDLAVRLAFAEGFLPKHFFTNGDGKVRAAKVLAAIEYGRAVGVEPMIALQNITMIDGKAGATALLIGAQLRRAGYKPLTVWLDSVGNQVPKESPFGQQPGQLWGCKVILSKGGEVTGEGVFSMTDAQRAGLVRDGSGWQRYPKDMLYARALTQSAREGAQDAVLGMQYTAEELGADVDADGQPVTLPPMADDVIEGELASGVPEATAGTQLPTATVIHSAPPTPVAAPPRAEQPSAPTDETQQGADEKEAAAPALAAVPSQSPAPPAEAPAPAKVAPLMSTSVTRRMGNRFSSIGPAAKRTNVVEVQPEAAETPATAPEAPVGPETQPEAAQSQPAPVELTEDLPDEGRAIYLRDLREGLRQEAATWHRLNVIYKNHVRNAVEGKPLDPVPPAEPNTGSDVGLTNLIGSRYPGRTLDNLGEAELQGLLAIAADGINTRRAAMLKDAVPEE